jgi:hypothetical protein
MDQRTTLALWTLALVCVPSSVAGAQSAPLYVISSIAARRSTHKTGRLRKTTGKRNGKFGTGPRFALCRKYWTSRL